MPDQEPATPARVGLPDPSTIIAEFQLQPAGAGGPAAAFPGEAATTYTILRTNQLDEYDSPSEFAPEGPAAAFNGSELEDSEGIHFKGTARKAAKISRSSADIEVFPDLAALIATLPAKSQMTGHHPKITDDELSDRVAQEERNIRVRAFLFAASREKDNDFHLIIGSDPDVSPLVCMTMELSGMPPQNSEHFATLKAAARCAQGVLCGPPGGHFREGIFHDSATTSMIRQSPLSSRVRCSSTSGTLTVRHPGQRICGSSCP